MSNLEETIAELRRVQAELTTSQAQFMEKVHTPSQEESKFESKVDELAITMAKLAKCGANLFMKGEMIPMATSYTQTKNEIHQHL